MPRAQSTPSVPPGLSELAEEFRRLDRERRRCGLSLGDAGRYHALFARLSDALALGERHRRVDGRRFLRIPFALELVVVRGNGRFPARCHDFGGGGCAIELAERLRPGDDVWLDGALLVDERHAVRGRATVVWVRPAAAPGGQPTYGLRFCHDVPAERDQIERLFYRVLDHFLAG
jgi:Tfp pilus assembly protein PilZ